VYLKKVNVADVRFFILSISLLESAAYLSGAVMNYAKDSA
jgi:hypothetical protein